MTSWTERVLRARSNASSSESSSRRAADERRSHARRDVDADARPRLERLPGLDRLRLALGLHRLGGPVVDRVARRAPCRLADEDAVDRCVRLEPRRGVDDVAGDHALALLRPGAERDERLPGVDADAELELGLLVEDPVADGERGADRALGVVLVRDRRAEHGHHGVADELLDCAAEALELVAQPRVVRPEQRAHLLRIHLLGARVKPTRSAKRTVTTLRSSSGVSRRPASGAAQALQKRAPSGFSWPQRGHVSITAEACIHWTEPGLKHQ